MKFARRWIAFGLAVLLLILAGGSIAYFKHRNQKRRAIVRAILREGERLQSRNRYEEAAALYERGLRVDPDNPDIYFELGECAIWTNDWPKIGSSFQRVIELQPSNVDAVVYLAKYHRHETADLDKARSILLAALEHNPRHAPALNLLGTVEYERQELDASRRAFEKTIEAAPRRMAAYRGLARTLMKLEQLQAAREILEKALRIDPQEPDIHYILGQVLMRLGNREEGREHIKYFKEMEKKRADVKDLRFMAHSHPDNPGVWYRLGLAYFKQQNFQEAIRSLEECVSVDPDFVPGRSLLGSLLLRDKKAARALHHIRAALRLDPESANDCNNLGVCYLLESRCEEAEEAFIQALRLDPGNQQFTRNLLAARAEKQKRAR